MTGDEIRVLLIEDNPGDARLLQEILAEATHPRVACTHVPRLDDGLAQVDQDHFDAILSDLSLPDAEELEAIIQLQAQHPQVPVIALTGLDRRDLAMEAVRRGAQDYLIKGDVDADLLVRAITYAIERKRIQESLARARDELEDRVRERTAQLEKVNKALSQEIEIRYEAEQALRDLNEHLEQRVDGRTAELTELNRHLVDKIEQHKVTELQLLKRGREVISLQAAAAATAASLDLQFVLDTVTWEMTSLLEADACSIYEWEPDQKLITLVAQYPPDDLVYGEPADRVSDLTGWPMRLHVLGERSVQHLDSDNKDLDPNEWDQMERSGILAQIMIPMVFQDRVAGLIVLGTGQPGQRFTDHEISLAHLLSNQAASAIENAKLYERAQREIARRREAEERITASLEEKEVLLKEIHHRVKNNLQVVSSLLYLQSQGLADPGLQAMFQDSQNRVRSMALVHERLYQTRDLAKIDFAQYISDLANYLFASYNVGAGYVALEVDAENVTLDVDTAVPCGLIVNELLSNSLKHAFPGQAQGGSGTRLSVDGQHNPDLAASGNHSGGAIRIGLRLQADRQVLLQIGDNGVGLPGEVDFQTTESLGLLLVNSLVRQLRGTIELGSGAGTEFRISFGLP